MAGEHATATGGSSDEDDLNWGDPASIGSWWYRPLGEPASWLALAYLFVGLLADLLSFVLVVTLLLASYALVLVGIGIPLVIGAAAVVDVLAAAARGRASWVGPPIERRELRTGSGLWGQFQATAGDPTRWRQIAYFLLAPFVAPVLFSLAVTAWGGVIAVPVVILVRDFSLARGVLAGLVAAALVGLAPRVVQQMGRAGAAVARALLGPDQVAVMQERVDSLSQSRAEILEAVTSERHRIERNLHDGAQQRLVALGIDLGLAQSKLAKDPESAAELLADAKEKTRAAIGELRVIGRGLHPAILADRGLDAALSAVVSDAPLPIALHVQPGLRLPLEIEETAYYVVSEAVSNILKHAQAKVASIWVVDDDRVLTITVHDDGRGGADLSRGSGLTGIAARVRGLDGTLDVHSPPGGPTVLSAELPHG